VKLLRDVEELEQAAAATRSEPSGTLRVTASLPLGANIVAPVLSRFRELYPRVRIDLRLTDRLVDLVEESVDVAIRAGTSIDARMIALSLGAHTINAFASPDYLTRRGTPRVPSDIEGHDCVNFRSHRSGQPLKWPFRVCDSIIEIIPPAGIIVDFSDAVARMLAAGGGIGLSPNYVAAPYVARGELVPLLTDFVVERFRLVALWPESRRHNPNVKAFVTFLAAEIFPSPLPWDVVVSAAIMNHGDGTPPPASVVSPNAPGGS
jgi:DNA-binding transcriptional LysR family regulator